MSGLRGGTSPAVQVRASGRGRGKGTGAHDPLAHARRGVGPRRDGHGGRRAASGTGRRGGRARGRTERPSPPRLRHVGVIAARSAPRPARSSATGGAGRGGRARRRRPGCRPTPGRLARLHGTLNTLVQHRRRWHIVPRTPASTAPGHTASAASRPPEAAGDPARERVRAGSGGRRATRLVTSGDTRPGGPDRGAAAREPVRSRAATHPGMARGRGRSVGRPESGASVAPGGAGGHGNGRLAVADVPP